MWLDEDWREKYDDKDDNCDEEHASRHNIMTMEGVEFFLKHTAVRPSCVNAVLRPKIQFIFISSWWWWWWCGKPWMEEIPVVVSCRHRHHVLSAESSQVRVRFPSWWGSPVESPLLSCQMGFALASFCWNFKSAKMINLVKRCFLWNMSMVKHGSIISILQT